VQSAQNCVRAKKGTHLRVWIVLSYEPISRSADPGEGRCRTGPAKLWGVSSLDLRQFRPILFESVYPIVHLGRQTETNQTPYFSRFATLLYIKELQQNAQGQQTSLYPARKWGSLLGALSSLNDGARSGDNFRILLH
jgi:hypothetical protein